MTSEGAIQRMGDRSSRQTEVGRMMAGVLATRIVSGLIIASAVVLFFEVMYPEVAFFRYLGHFILIIFAVELALRAYSSRSLWTFLRTYWIDLLSLLPLFSAGLRGMGALRLLRLLRLGPLLGRVNKRFASILRQTFGEQFFILTLIFVFVMGVALGLLNVEGDNPAFDSAGKTIWWSLLSMIAGEPVGEMPETTIGKLLTLAIMLGGLTVFALFTGTVSAVMADRFRHSGRQMLVNVDDLFEHVLVCGWNRSGRTLVEELQHSNDTQELAVVIVAEKRPELTEEQAADPKIFIIEGDCTNAEVLRKAGVVRASRAILLADKSIPHRSDQDRDARTILSALMIEKLRPGIFTSAELLLRDNEPALAMAGVEEVVIADEYSANLLASSSRVRGVTEIVNEIFSVKYGNQFFKRKVPAAWAGKTFLAVQQLAKTEHDALLVSVERPTSQRTSASAPEGRTTTNPPADYVLQAGDSLIVLSKSEPSW